MDSVLGQTLKNIEVICVDDGSTDHSPEILARYAQQDNRVQVIRQKNAGPGVARNIGMSRATGKYLIFLDSDDWFEPDFLEQMFHKSEETGADISVCRAKEFDSLSGNMRSSDWMLNTGILPGDIFTPSDIGGNIFRFTHGWPWDKLFSTSFIRKHQLSYPELRNSEDLVFVFNALMLAEKIVVEDRVLVYHRVNRSASVSNSRTGQLTAPYDAVSEVEQFINDSCLTAYYHSGLMAWAMEFLIWHVSTIADCAGQKSCLKLFRTKWLPALEKETSARAYCVNMRSYLKYLFARYAPFPVFRFVSITYRVAKEALKRITSCAQKKCHAGME